MKYRLPILLVVMFCLTGVCRVFAGSELVCDLNKGRLGQFEINSSVELKQLSEFIGESIDNELNFASYHNKGIEIMLQRASTTDEWPTILEIQIFYNEHVDEATGKQFKKYEGKIIPAFDAYETKETISAKFGKPDSYIERNGFGRQVYIYKKAYGGLSFEFDNNNLFKIYIIAPAIFDVSFGQDISI